MFYMRHNNHYLCSPEIYCKYILYLVFSGHLSISWCGLLYIFMFRIYSF